MNDYLRFIGINEENADESQIKNAHFATLRKYNSKKYSATNPRDKQEAELAIDYLRRAQYNRHLPLPKELAHLLPPTAATQQSSSNKETRRSTPQTVTSPAKTDDKANRLEPSVKSPVTERPSEKPLPNDPSRQEAVEPPTPAKIAKPEGPQIGTIQSKPEVESVGTTNQGVFSGGILTAQPKLDDELASTKPKLVPPTINCPNCEWEILTDTDSYCSGCGKTIVNIEVPNEVVIYIDEASNTPYTKSFRITNTGLIPINLAEFEVLQVKAKVSPYREVYLDTNEAIAISITVDPTTYYGRRSGTFRFLYHGKVKEIPLLLKRPPEILLKLLHPKPIPLKNGYEVLLPLEQQTLCCKLETDSEMALTINCLSFIVEGEKRWESSKLYVLDAAHPVEFNLGLKGLPAVGVLAVSFEELGVRNFILQITHVPTAILSVSPTHLLGNEAIILSRQKVPVKLSLQNKRQDILGQGKAEKIEIQGIPDWLTINPASIAHLGAGERVELQLLADTSGRKPGFENVNLQLRYYDPQLDIECNQPIDIKFEFKAPDQSDSWIAIDFGTSNSCATLFEKGRFKILSLEDADLQESPTCLQFVDIEEGIVEHGVVAYSKLFTSLRDLRSTAWAFKPLLMSDKPKTQTFLDVRHERPHHKTADELVEIYASRLFETIESKHGLRPRKIVLTYPVLFGKKQRERLSEAFKKAGVENVVLATSEPLALAINYFYKNQQILGLESFGVFDFGGGTTDIAILRLEQSKGQFKVRLLDVAGINLGGELLTFELARYLYEKLVPAESRSAFAFPKSIEELNSVVEDEIRVNYSQLARSAEELKRNFYSSTSFFDEEFRRSLHDGKSWHVFSTFLEKDAIESLLRKHIEKATDALRAMLQRLCLRGLLSEGKLDFILLGGNSSKLPMVKEMLQEFTGQILVDEDVKTGVMKGALLYVSSPDSLPFSIDEIKHTLPCDVGLAGKFHQLDVVFHRGTVAGTQEALHKRKLKIRDSVIELYYYFGYEQNPQLIQNPQVNCYPIRCGNFADGVELEVEFELLPEGEGIEVRLTDGKNKDKYQVPLVG
ncbi:MAG: Hsp70 family protein [Acidobacteriota bacterium]|nr:Hsp70 family protein [Blastocatellia bacterium]MDW8412359.1 Hsp70 family protein [Acidobacteriota bacterium]